MTQTKYRYEVKTWMPTGGLKPRTSIRTFIGDDNTEVRNRADRFMLAEIELRGAICCEATPKHYTVGR